MTRIFFLCLISLIIQMGSAHALDSCIVPDGKTYYVDEHSQCREVANSTGQDIMVPTKTAGEWSTGGSDFITNTPASVTLVSCTTGTETSCSEKCSGSGESVGGYCWYYGANGQSCDTVCAGEGLSCDLTGTRDYAGSAGTNANCNNVLDALSAPNITTADFMGDHGCHSFGGSLQRRRGTGTTTSCSSSAGATVRACACE